jgi:hypothetical protein
MGCGSFFSFSLSPQSHLREKDYAQKTAVVNWLQGSVFTVGDGHVVSLI